MKKEKFAKFTIIGGGTVYINPDLVISFQAEGTRQTLIRTVDYNITVEENHINVSKLLEAFKKG